MLSIHNKTICLGSCIIYFVEIKNNYKRIKCSCFSISNLKFKHNLLPHTDLSVKNGYLDDCGTKTLYYLLTCSCLSVCKCIVQQSISPNVLSALNNTWLCIKKRQMTFRSYTRHLESLLAINPLEFELFSSIFLKVFL
jgi:hypothetical protein